MTTTSWTSRPTSTSARGEYDHRSQQGLLEAGNPRGRVGPRHGLADTEPTSLMQASQFVRSLRMQGLKIGCLEEIAWRMGFIDDAQLEALAQPLVKSGYGTYLLDQLRRGR